MAKYNIDVNLIGQDGNAFFIMSSVQRALRRAGASSEEIGEYVSQATAGDYNQLLSATMEWVNVK
jgi:alkylhydroperoxidase/carboxymuconolactone decarboxylase family protein YurZ